MIRSVATVIYAWRWLRKNAFVDASESSITSREQAIDALTALGRNEIEQLLIYVPTSKPIEEEKTKRSVRVSFGLRVRFPGW